MKHPRHILQILALAAALLAVGQHAMATTKSVTYTITGSIKVGNGNENYLVTLTRSGDDPFDGSGPDYSLEMSPESLYATNGTYGDYTFSLADGFKLQLQWGAGSNVQIRFNENKNAYYIYPTAEGTNKKITYTVSCPDNYYYTTHVMMTGTESGFQLGMPQTSPNSGSIDTDYDSVWNFSETYYSAYSFGQITITYSDTPPLSIFESAGTDTYNIKDKHDLRHLANYVNNGGYNCSGLTFLQTTNITCDASYVPIGNKSNTFRGTYDGLGNTISDIRVTRTGDTSADCYIGIFGRIGSGSTVENVVLASSTFTGHHYVGGIVGHNDKGTVSNCRVESSVTIKSGHDSARCHGGITGYMIGSSAKVIGCLSAASLERNDKSLLQYYGGIVGKTQSGTVQDCLYTGTTIAKADYYGTIVGDNLGTLRNNYNCGSIGGVGSENDGPSDQDGARRARTVTLGENVALVGDETVYDVSGLTAIGTGNYALCYNDGTTTKIYSGEGQVLTLTYTGSVPSGYSVVYTVTKTSDGSDITADVLSGSTLTMPAYNVTVSAIVLPPQVLYIDADGSTKYCSDYTVIDPSTIAYGNKNSEDWYVVRGTVNMTELSFGGPAHVILCDGASLTISGGEGQIETGYGLTIYGQSEGTGSITVNSGYDEDNQTGIGINARDFTLCGGSITLAGDICGLYATESLTVYRGSINATGNYTGSVNYHTVTDYLGAGICSESITINGGTVVGTGSWYGINQNNRSLPPLTINGGSVSGTGTLYTGVRSFYGITINGGQVNASGGSGGLVSDYLDITLGCSSASDYITATSFGAGGDILVKDGQTLTDGTDTYTGTLSAEQKAAIAGQTLRLDIPASVELTLVQGTKDGVTAYWGTFYGVQRYVLPEGAVAYTMDSGKHLYRLGDDGRTIREKTAVVIISDRQSITLTKDEGTTEIIDHAPDGADPTEGNFLQGTVSAVAVSSLSGTPYVLSVDSNGVIGFRQYLGTDAIPAHKAYYVQ